MESQQQLENLRVKLQDELEFHQSEVLRLTKALDALETVEGLLGQDGRQKIIPETDPYSELGPDELVANIIDSSSREWTMKDIIAEAAAGGKQLEQWTSPYNVLFVAAKRLVERGRIQKVKKGKAKFARVVYKRLADDGVSGGDHSERP